MLTEAWEARTVARASATAPWGSGPHVLEDGLLPPEGVARRVVRPIAHRDRPLHHGTDPLPHPPRGLRLVVPDRRQDRQRVSRGHVGHGHRPDARERKRRADCAARPARTSLYTEEPSSFPIRLVARSRARSSGILFLIWRHDMGTMWGTMPPFGKHKILIIKMLA